MEETTINGRVSWVIGALNMTQNSFAKALNTSSSRVSNIVSGRNKPDSEFLASIVREFRNVNATWLLTGEGIPLYNRYSPGINDKGYPVLLSLYDEVQNAQLKAQVNAQLNAQNIINHVSEPVHLHEIEGPIDLTATIPKVELLNEGPRRHEIIVATQDTTGNPTFSLINYKAAANYLTGYQSQEYFRQLAPVSLPRQLVGNPKQGIILQIEGDSMTPRFQHGDYVAAIYLDASEWAQVRDLDCYIVVSRSHGIQFKRIKNRLSSHGFIRCKSDNRRHNSYNIEEEDLLQLFRFVLHISPDASNPNEDLYGKMENLEDTTSDLRSMYEQILEQMTNMQKDVTTLKNGNKKAD